MSEAELRAEVTRLRIVIEEVAAFLGGIGLTAARDELKRRAGAWPQ